MAKGNRVTPYKYKGKVTDKGKRKATPLKQIEIDMTNHISRMKLMSSEEVLGMQRQAAQNALTLFNKLLVEMEKRVPEMNDEVLANAMLSVWGKVGNNKK